MVLILQVLEKLLVAHLETNRLLGELLKGATAPKDKSKRST